MQLSAIVAMTDNRVIGINNQLPWHLPADLRYFKKLTLNHSVLMGRKTHESIGKALPGRRNLVISRDRNYSAVGCEIFHSMDDALAQCNNESEVFIIGGAAIFEELLPRTQKIYLTMVHQNVKGDAYFPVLNEKEWRETRRENFKSDAENEYDYSFIVLERMVK